ncbi:hypothetical protein SLEP1_g23061 [Rubroshorea leprosula]|uniref:Uncharacterized protein n=1 Tax=Rubroshorea leprosula TaxID=152421 RepID=A0AAV5JKN9_9ROSI|nr:hypothetical protein SLEP1_g23061 [Rubroshorea leprosula]
MVVPSALQDLPESITLESSANSSTTSRSGDHHSPSSKSSSSKGTPSDEEGARTGLGSPSTTNIEESAPMVEEWENKTIGGKLDNIRKAPQSLHASFRFKATLHHEVTDGAATIKGFKKLGEMRAHEDSDAENDMLLIRRQMSSGTQPVHLVVARSSNVLVAPTHDGTEIESASTSASASSPRIVYPKVALFECEQGARGQAVGSLKVVNELKEELDKALAEKASGIQATKDEAGLVEERDKKVEFKRDNALNELSSLRQWVAATNQNLVCIEEALKKTKSLAFFKGEEIDEQGKSLTSLAYTTMQLKWELNEDGVPTWPPFILEEREDLEGLPTFDAWVARVPKAEVEPFSTPSTSQPFAASANSPPAHADASISVNLMDD